MLASLYLKHSNGVCAPGTKGACSRIADRLDSFYTVVEDKYRKTLDLGLAHRDGADLAVVLFAAAIYITRFIGKELTPSEDQSRFVIRFQTPIDYSVDQVDQMGKKAEEILRKFPEIKSIMYSQAEAQPGDEQR